jgi:ferrochelatase
MKHSAPSIEDGVGELVARGAGRIVAVVLAPHYSRMSVGEYAERALAAAAVAPGPCELTVVRSWHLAPGYLDFLAGAVQDAVAELPPDARHGAHVVFTAHSLPTRILDDGDPYRAQLAETATSVAQRLGLHRWSIAWQSAGRTADPWIGPDILQVIDELRAGDASAVVVCAAGFVSDHLEVLYDLDVEARARARQQGLAFARTRSPNDDPVFVRALADVVHEHLAAVPA